MSGGGGRPLFGFAFCNAMAEFAEIESAPTNVNFFWAHLDLER